MGKFIGNYLQHIMDIIIGDSNSYGDICDRYMDYHYVSVESVKKSHTNPTRGNLPTGIGTNEAYESLIKGFYPTLEDREDFARRLDKALIRDRLFPQEWANQKEQVDGFSDAFDDEVFRSYIIDLLRKDKDAKKRVDVDDMQPKSKLTELSQNEITLRREAPGQTIAARDTHTLTPLAFSRQFFTEGARSVEGLGDAEFAEELRRLSDIFNPISTVEFHQKPRDFDSSNNLIIALKDWIGECMQTSGNREILKVKGPLGSYKNRLMQYLYLAIWRDLRGVTPVYIDIAAYEKAAEANDVIGEKDFFAAFEKDVQTAEKIFAAAPHTKPLLMLDGVRDFTCRNESLYYSMNARLKNKGWYLIVCMDTDFTMNNQNKYDSHPLVSSGYECYVRLRSMNLNRKQESIEFIRNCVDVFHVSLPNDVTPEQIYESLVHLNFLTLDAYWLMFILQSYLREILNHKNNLSALYTAICVGFLNSHQSMESAAEFAYEFEFGDRNFHNANPYFDLRWRLIRRHRSVLDFLIAKFYIKKVSELNLQSGKEEKNIEKLAFFNMVLPKNITRFVITMLKGVEDYERQIMIIAKRYYDHLNLFGKSELTFWMARLQSQVRKKDCVRLLQKYNEKEKARYEEDNFSSVEEKRKTAFLLRGINVSLIYEQDKEALKYYLESLLTDKIANSVNRGFHLEYYGDKPYIPNQSLLDFEDDITCGESTFTVICLSLDRRIRRKEAAPAVALLEVMTLCNLIQARMEQADAVNVFDVDPYIDKCVRYLKWILPQRVTKGSKDVCMYFHWMFRELTKYKNERREHPEKRAYHPSDIFNKFSDAAVVKRTGWVKLHVPGPENIVEHMYNCWLLGMLYLPSTYEDEGYNKESVLKMLLIHDLGETETGDIPRPEKRENKSYYDQQERIVMQGLFLSGTYPHAKDLSQYMRLWDAWDCKDGINYRVAKDIDNIQTIYQFCRYYLQEPERFTQDDIGYWLAGVEELDTEIGKDMADLLILQNPLFQDIIGEYASDDEN